MVSFNHYAFGSVGEFYYRYILGIQPLEPGFAKVRIRPFLDKRLGAVSGSFMSRHGEIRVAWDENTIEISTPVEAELCLPGQPMKTAEPGEYHFVIED